VAAAQRNSGHRLAVDALSSAVAAWRRDVSSVDDQRLWEPMGPAAGTLAEQPVAGFVEHIHDEFVPHSAEVALPRDLHRTGSIPDSASRG
jgi:hypothetical protein